MNAITTLKRLILNLRGFRAQILEEERANAKNKASLKRYLTSHAEPKLELGASEPREGFVTADLHLTADLTFDFTKKFPLPDDTFRFVYCSHVLEHFYHDQLTFLLKEVLRILKPGGEFSICVPNARPFIESYFSNEKFDLEKRCTYKPALHYYSKIDVINYMAYMGDVHRMMYDEENLKAILESQGFRNVQLRPFTPGLDLEQRRAESLYLICHK